MLQFSMQIDKEQYLIDRLHSDYIGDDAAIVGDTLYSMDAFFEGVHFEREWMSVAQIGRKAMLVNLSDAIAMNAQPQYALVSVSLPPQFTYEEIEILSKSMEETAKEYGCEIIGGDTIGGDKLHLSITIISKSQNPLLRRGLKEDDYLAYTGVLGESKRDLEKLFRGEEIAENSRFYTPTLRADFINQAREYLHVGMDISDGLYCDTNKLLDINNYGFTLLQTIEDDVGLSGEEYEMLIGFPKRHYREIMQIAKKTNTPLTLFANVTQNTQRFICQSHHF